MKYHVRPAELKDIEAISSVAKQSWTDTYASIFPEKVIEQFVSRAYSQDALSDAINRDRSLQERYFHVALNSEGNVIAFSQSAPMDPDDATFELTRIYALPEAQGSGVGAALLHHLLRTAPNLKKLYAWVEEENIAGRTFYERHHFKQIEEKTDILFGYETVLLKYQYVNDNKARPADTTE